MISFSCSRCGMKLKVKDEFAGRSSKCPTCKQPLVVPALDKTVANVEAGEIDGTDSSLAKVGHDGGVTLEPAAATRAGQRSVLELLARRTKKDGRYLVEREIARGGMGVVLRAVDCDIRREVAVKYLLDQTDFGKKARFIEEAQITGQLEHPNIVPIHELGVDARKRLFFSMKMVKGRSLADVLDELRQNPKQAEKEYSLGKMLNILVSVCNALAYAHSCGVVHRDLKPANIMIGDFGEVYVMDWGLAKVLKDGRKTQDPAPMATVATSISAAAPLAVPLSKSPSSKVETSRGTDADLTQEGAVLGTPVYMPPEQATGRVEYINQRSDVYSLGAILYEMLTRQPPVGKEGGYLAILMRVMQGEIVPPEQRDPSRAKAGKIPKELSAVAMKALAMSPPDRYQTVDSFRRDIERFQEGRSVSAKADTVGELLWKLVKRNRAVSAATFLFLPVLLGALLYGFLSYRAYAKELKEKNDRTGQAIPAFMRSARLLGYDGQFKEALEQVDFALHYEPNNHPARLLRGQLLIAQKDWPAGRSELERYLRDRSDDADARKLLEVCAKGKADDPAVLWSVAELFQRQKVPGLAVHLYRDVERSVKARQPLLALYQKRIEEAWPGLGTRLLLDQMGNFLISLHDCKQVVALDPLRGMQLSALDLSGCDRVMDLSPLRGMHLTSLSLLRCEQVSDLTPLQGMNLESLSFIPQKNTKGMDVLRRMKSLQTVYTAVGGGFRTITSREFWKRYDAGEFKR